VILSTTIRALDSCSNVTTSVTHYRFLLKLLKSFTNIHPFIVLFVVKCCITGLKAILMEVILDV
jgi:hypothetical protein